MKTIWLPRPAEDSNVLAAQLAKLSIPSLIAPVLRIVPRALTPEELGGRPDAILLTSRHGAAALPQAWHKTPVYCVGAATADAAREAGYTEVFEAQGNVLSLVAQVVVAEDPGAKLLYLCGEEVSIDLVSLLAADGIHVHPVIAYKAQAEAALPPELTEAIGRGEVGGVAFFSVRSAKIAMTLLQGAGLETTANSIVAYCLSVAIADAAGSFNWRALKVAESPVMEAMIKLIASEKIPAI